MADGVSFEMLTQPFTDMLAEVDVARDKGTRAGLQATGRLIAKTARGAAPVYQGSDPRATAESGSLKKSIKASRVTRNGASDYSSTVQPKGSVHGSSTGTEKRGVPLYRSKQEEKYGFMAGAISAANGAGAKAIYEAAYDAAFREVPLMAAEVMAILRANTSEFTAKMGEAKAEMEDLSKGGSSNMEKLSSVGKAALFGIAAGAVVVAVAGVKMATDFQQSMTQLVTGAGESKKNIKMVSDGILGMAGAVGQTPAQLAAGMYLIESAGYHGAAGLTVLKAAAEGAAVGNADMATVAGAVTTALTDYHLKASDANNVTSALVETVASGKTTMDALGGSLGRLLPLASNFHVSLQTALGAVATMTNTGLTAKMATMQLGNMLSSIESPASTAGKALAAMGLSSQQLVGMIGSGPQGLQQALALVAKAAGTEFPKGSAAYNVAVKDALGGTTSLKAALALTGATGQQFADNVKNIGDRLHGSGKEVQGFSSVQKDLGFQMKQAEAAGEALLIQIGERLIPIIEKAITAVEAIVTWFAKHKTAAEALGIAIGVLVAGPIAVYIAGMVAAAAATVAAAAPWLAIIAIAVAVGLAVYEIVNHWHDIVAFFKDLWKDVKKIFDDAWSAIKGIIEDAWHVILTIFEDATLAGILYAHWRGILSGVETAWDEIVSFFSAIPGRILGALSSLGSDLLSWIQDAWSTFKTWIETAWGLEVDFWIGIPTKIIAGIAAFGSMLLGWIQTAWNGFKSFIESAWNTEVSFWTGIPSRIISALASLVGDLLSLGGSVMGSFAHGVSGAWGVIASWFTGLPAAIISAIGNVIDLLYNIGKTIIDSLKRGLVDAFNDVKNFVSGIASDIASLKGPIGYDATLLIPHGMAIMQSLRQGLQAGYASSVAPYMSGIAGQIAGTSFGTGGISPIAGGGGGAASVSGGAGGGGMQPINLILNGDVLGTALIPILQMKGAQYQRTVPLPIFGTANASVS